MTLKRLVVSLAALGAIVVAAAPDVIESNAEAQVYGQDEACAERCRYGMKYCFTECQKPLKECVAKCDIDPKHKSPKQFNRKERECVKGCTTKTVPCSKGCDVQQHVLQEVPAALTSRPR